MLDVSMGSYPYVTSSNTTISGIIAGLTLNPKNITETIGVTPHVLALALSRQKIPESTVTLLAAQLWKRSRLTICEQGRNETPGGWPRMGNIHRPKTSLWLDRFVNPSCYFSTSKLAVTYSDFIDLVVVKHGHMQLLHVVELDQGTPCKNYSEGIEKNWLFMQLDVLDSFETIKVAIAYKDKSTGKELDSYPADHNILDNAEVVYHEMPGWKKPTTNARTYYDLPKQARDNVEVQLFSTAGWI
ncbi:hypothetical protein ACJZ2D_006014 [Fusarium nematophilum]